MTYLELLTRLAERRGAKANPLDVATKRRYGAAINEVHRQVLRPPGRESLRQGVVSFASVANQKMYALPTSGIARINWITETTNDRKLEYRTPQWLDAVAPDPTAGTPWAWIPRGYGEVHTQPSDASEVFVKSTSGNDIGKAFVEGYITGGYYRTASVTMTGTTAVSLSTAITSFMQITKFYLSAAAVGTVTLHEDSGSGTELARIGIGRARAQFYQFQLYNTPSAVTTYYADVLRSIPDMVQDFDEPLLPEDFHDLLIDMAELKEFRKQDDPNRYAMLAADVKRGDADLQTFLTSHPDWRPTFGGEPTAISTLGAWFPADVRVG